MKRIRLLILLSIVALALPLAIFQGVAGATGGTGATTSVSIRQYADFDAAGVQLDVALNVRCTGGLGLADVSVTQYPPETGHPVTGHGFNFDVVCDGQTHSVGVTVTGTVYDPGKAYAEATVTPPPGGSAPGHAARWITIQVV